MKEQEENNQTQIVKNAIRKKKNILNKKDISGNSLELNDCFNSLSIYQLAVTTSFTEN